MSADTLTKGPPMRVLFTVSNWAGHYFSMIPLAWALHSAGHEVRVLCAGSEADTVRRAGVTPVPLLQAMPLVEQARLQNYLNARDGRWDHDELPLHPETGEVLQTLDDFDLREWFGRRSDGIREMGRQSTDAAVEFARSWQPHALVHDIVSLEGPLLSAVLGIPSTVNLWGPTGTHETEIALQITPVDHSKAFERHGLEPISNDLITDVFDPTPAVLEPPARGRRHKLRYVPYNGPGSAPVGLPSAGSRPRVVLVWGTSVSSMYGPTSFVVPRVVDAATRAGVELVVALTAADRARLGPDVPDGVVVLENAPLHMLLEGASAVVHHAGAGCTMTTMAAGVPQLALTNGLDQTLTGQRLAEAGIALSMPVPHAGVPEIATALQRLVAEPSFRDRAGELQAEIAGFPTPARVVADMAERAAVSRP